MTFLFVVAVSAGPVIAAMLLIKFIDRMQRKWEQEDYLRLQEEQRKYNEWLAKQPLMPCEECGKPVRHRWLDARPGVKGNWLCLECWLKRRREIGTPKGRCE